MTLALLSLKPSRDMFHPGLLKQTQAFFFKSKFLLHENNLSIPYSGTDSFDCQERLAEISTRTLPSQTQQVTVG